MTLNKPDPCTLQLAVGDQRAAEGHASDVGAQVGHRLQHPGGWVGVKMGELNHVLRNAGEDGSQTHEAVEGRHQLGQVGDLDTLGNGEACRRERYLNRKREEIKQKKSGVGIKESSRTLAFSHHIWLERSTGVKQFQWKYIKIITNTSHETSG